MPIVRQNNNDDSNKNNNINNQFACNPKSKTKQFKLIDRNFNTRLIYPFLIGENSKQRYN